MHLTHASRVSCAAPAQIPARAALKPRRRPRQARSQVTVTAILEATARVVLKHGHAGCTTKRVAEVAGVGIGSLYEYFPNKEALVAALIEREVDSFMAVLRREMEATTGRPFAQALRLALAATIVELESRRKLVRRLMIEYPHMGQLAAVGRLPAQTAELAALCLQRWSGELRLPDSPASYYVLANMLLGACVSQMLRPASQISTAALLDALVEILLRVLQPHAQPAYTADAAE